MRRHSPIAHLRASDLLLLVRALLFIVLGYTVFRTLFTQANSSFGQEIVLIFLGSLVTVLIATFLLSRQTELELRKEGNVLPFSQRAEIYPATIEKSRNWWSCEFATTKGVAEMGITLSRQPLYATHTASNASIIRRV